jgi:hypothetical protein
MRWHCKGFGGPEVGLVCMENVVAVGRGVIEEMGVIEGIDVINGSVIDVVGSTEVSRWVGAGKGVTVGRGVFIGATTVGAATVAVVFCRFDAGIRPVLGPQPPARKRTANPAKQICRDFMVFSLSRPARVYPVRAFYGSPARET